MEPATSPHYEAVLAALAALPGHTNVRVVLRAPEAPSALAEPQPRDFETAAAYRVALIERHQQAHLSGKQRIETIATSLGLGAHSASTLNAVAVEGAAAKVLALLKQLPGIHVLLDEPSRREP